MNNRVDKKEYNKLIRLPQLLVSVMIAFSVFLFAPIDTYHLNKVNFDFTINNFIVYLFTAFLFSFCALWSILELLKLMPRKIYIIVLALLFGVGLAFYIQGNFLCINNNVLMGEEPVWTDKIRPLLFNTFIWGCVITASICFAVMNARKFLKTATFVCALVIIMEGGSLLFSEVFSGKSSNSNERAYTSVKDRYTVSANGDIIVFLLDAFDTRYMQMALDENPEYLNSYADFTYYPNTSTSYQRTDPAVVNMLTGNIYYNDIPFFTWVDQSIDNAPFFKTLKENGYTIDVYALSDNFFSASMIGTIDNLMKVEPTVTNPYLMVYTLMKMSLYKFGPIAFQPFMYGNYSRVFYDCYDMRVMKSTWLEREYYDGLVANGGFCVDSSKKYFKFYHLHGAHTVANLDRYGNSIKEGSGTLEEQALGSLYLVGETIEALKTCGTYDQSMIVICADHGMQDAEHEDIPSICNPIFMTKYPGQHSESGKMMIEERNQIALEDFTATCLDGAGIDYSAFGRPAKDWTEGNRNRFYYSYRYLFPTFDGDFYLDSLTEYKVPEDARDLDNYKPTGKTYSH